MQPPEGSDLNPYAAPRSDVTPPREEVVRLKRPTSSKWLVAMTIFLLIGYALTTGKLIVEGGIEAVGEWPWQPIYAGLDLILRLAFFVAVIFGRAKPWGYFLALPPFSWLLVIGSKNFFTHAIFPFGRFDLATFIFGLIFLGLEIYLFYRFTFGLPSRRFYQVTRK